MNSCRFGVFGLVHSHKFTLCVSCCNSPIVATVLFSRSLTFVVTVAEV